MALKDWKRGRKDTWLKKEHHPEDAGSGVITIARVPQPKGYLYYFIESDNLWKPKVFKTRAKALGYAKNYMRRN